VLGGMGSFESFCELYIKAASGASVWASNSPLRLAFEEFECDPQAPMRLFCTGRLWLAETPEHTRALRVPISTHV